MLMLPPPILVRKGGAYYGIYYILYRRCCGWCYNANVTASESGDRREVFHLDHILSFIVAVAAGVACHYIIKWLDGDK